MKKFFCKHLEYRSLKVCTIMLIFLFHSEKLTCKRVTIFTLSRLDDSLQEAKPSGKVKGNLFLVKTDCQLNDQWTMSIGSKERISIYLSIYLSIHPSIYLSTHIQIYEYIIYIYTYIYIYTHIHFEDNVNETFKMLFLAVRRFDLKV
jgi:hypothetical protein